jgi:NAD(P)-dependent dehydrogenase (short-subunit alcohol dehydrogenase family)
VTGLLDGSIALVVGGAKGIGRAVVERFVAEGAKVAVVDRDADALGALTGAYAGAVRPILGDAALPQVHEHAVADVIEHLGDLDCLVCCAGVFDFRAAVCDLEISQLSTVFDELFAVNVKCALLATRAAMGSLQRRRGSVVLTASGAAFNPEGGGVLYGASKWAVRGLVAHLARELAPEVRVNGVAPGGTAGTSLSAPGALDASRTVAADPGRDERIAAGALLGRAASPADHAGTYLYLASPMLSPAVTGVVVRSDGGRGEPIPRKAVGAPGTQGAAAARDVRSAAGRRPGGQDGRRARVGTTVLDEGGRG